MSKSLEKYKFNKKTLKFTRCSHHIYFYLVNQCDPRQLVVAVVGTEHVEGTL